MRLWFAILIVLISGLAQAESVKGEIKVIYPENIQFLMEKFKDGFQKQNPGASVILQKGAGPEQIQQLYSGNETADILVLSDDRLVRSSVQTMYQSTPTDFMSDEIAIIAGKNAKYFDELTVRYWNTYLLRPDVKVGIPDTAKSYAAIRVPLVWKLAETWVHQMSLFESLTAKLKTTEPQPSIISALQSGNLDYSFDYATQGKQNGLRVFRLLKYYNLGDPTLENVYKSAVIETVEKKLLHGEPIIYSIGELKKSKNQTAVQAFIEYVSGNEGRAILQAEELAPVIGGRGGPPSGNFN
ncbi:extracellular solute-binding protein [bacterium]|nr:extracellular solute-binding protein [bacterium]